MMIHEEIRETVDSRDAGGLEPSSEEVTALPITMTSESTTSPGIWNCDSPRGFSVTPAKDDVLFRLEEVDAVGRGR